MAKVVRRTKYKFKPRFFALVTFMFFIVSLGVASLQAFFPTTPPNFYGWTTQDVMNYVADQSDLSVTYELVYSYDVLHNRVIDQEVVASSTDEMKEVTVYVSKGYPIMDNFVNQPFSKLEAFAKPLNLQIQVNDMTTSDAIITSQSIPWGATLLKDTSIKVTVAEDGSLNEVPNNETDTNNGDEINSEGDESTGTDTSTESEEGVTPEASPESEEGTTPEASPESEEGTTPDTSPGGEEGITPETSPGGEDEFMPELNPENGNEDVGETNPVPYS